MKPSRAVVAAPLAMIVLLIATSVRAQPTERVAVPELKPLLKLAIDRGSAHGVIVGESASYVREKFDTTAPIEIDVRALHALAQSGCSRLEVSTRQKGVLENGRRADKELTYQVSYCLDGQFPEAK